MQVCVITDQEAMGSRIRRAVISTGLDCPASHIIGREQAESHLVHARPEMTIVTTGGDVESAVSTVTRLRELTPGCMLAVGSYAEPRLILRMLRLGVDDFVDEDAVEADLPAAMNRRRAGRTEIAPPGRVLSVVSPSGGGGASMIATNLAVALAGAHKRSMLVDLKARSGDLAAMLDLKPQHTTQDLCRVADRIDRVLLEQTLVKHASNVHLLASPRDFEPAWPASAEGMARILDLGRALYPRVIADVDPSLPPDSIEALRLSDSVLIVLRLEFNSLRNAKGMLEHLERRQVDMARVKVIGNRQGQPKEIAAAKIEDALGRKLFALLPDDPKPALGSQNNGVPVLREYPTCRLSKSLLKLASALDALPATPATTMNGARM